MDKLRLAAVLCLTLCGGSTSQAVKILPKSDPNAFRVAWTALARKSDADLLREPLTARALPAAPISREPNYVPDQPLIAEVGGLPRQYMDPNLCSAYREYLLAYLDGERQKIDEQRVIIASTNRMGTCVFVVVHILLVLAMGVALLEFLTAHRTRSVKREREEIELSFQKIGLKTSMHGTVLLVFSLVLYFLFLKFVYTTVAI